MGHAKRLPATDSVHIGILRLRIRSDRPSAQKLLNIMALTRTCDLSYCTADQSCSFCVGSAMPVGNCDRVELHGRVPRTQKCPRRPHPGKPTETRSPQCGVSNTTILSEVTDQPVAPGPTCACPGASRSQQLQLHEGAHVTTYVTV